MCPEVESYNADHAVRHSPTQDGSFLLLPHISAVARPFQAPARRSSIKGSVLILETVPTSITISCPYTLRALSSLPVSGYARERPHHRPPHHPQILGTTRASWPLIPKISKDGAAIAQNGTAEAVHGPYILNTPRVLNFKYGRLDLVNASIIFQNIQ